jgi:kynureninase
MLAVVAVASGALSGTAAGEPVFGAHNFSGGNWGAVSFGSFTTATASWVEPSVTCNSTDNLFAPWVGTNTYQLVISDTTKGWSKSVSKSLSSRHSSAEAIIESPTDSYPNISGGVQFTGVKFNGSNLAATSPSALDADDRGVRTPGSIASDGTDFTMTRH